MQLKHLVLPRIRARRSVLIRIKLTILTALSVSYRVRHKPFWPTRRSTSGSTTEVLCWAAYTRGWKNDFSSCPFSVLSESGQRVVASRYHLRIMNGRHCDQACIDLMDELEYICMDEHICFKTALCRSTCEVIEPERTKVRQTANTLPKISAIFEWVRTEWRR